MDAGALQAQELGRGYRKIRAPKNAGKDEALVILRCLARLPRRLVRLPPGQRRILEALVEHEDVSSETARHLFPGAKDNNRRLVVRVRKQLLSSGRELLRIVLRLKEPAPEPAEIHRLMDAYQAGRLRTPEDLDRIILAMGKHFLDLGLRAMAVEGCEEAGRLLIRSGALAAGPTSKRP